MQDALGNLECSICRGPVDLGTEVTLLPCAPWYHGECISWWLGEYSDTCPYCNRDVSAPAGPVPELTPTDTSEIATAENPNLGFDGAGEQEDQEMGEADEWDEEEYDGDEYFDLQHITEP